MREKGGEGGRRYRMYKFITDQMQWGQIIGLLERERQFTSTTDENSFFMHHI